jgi:multicomponent Na+:H+ antiporter subunit G
MSLAREIIALIAFGFGALFGIFGVIGLFRFPDPYSRLQAGALAGTTAVISVFIGALVLAPNLAIAARIIVIIIFFLISSPTGAHLVARFAWNSEIIPWKPQDQITKETSIPADQTGAPDKTQIPKGNLLRATLMAQRAKKQDTPPDPNQEET